MKRFLQQLLDDALAELRRTEVLVPSRAGPCTVERTRDRRHGDFASNVALTLAKEAGLAPRELAQRIVAVLANDARLAQVAVAGPGFINFTLSPAAFQSVVPAILDAGEGYGRSGRGAGQAVQVEFVSANPTGPLHVGHGRGAAYGAAVADLLEAVGFRVHREYYVNDAGRQMDILAASVWLRYLELCGEKIVFPANGYQGDYVWDIAANLHREHADAFHAPGARVYADLPPDEPEGGDRETYVDALIARARELLGAQRYRTVFDAGLVAILADIRRDLEEFGVFYQEWFSERSLVEDGAVTRAVERLRAGGHTYERDGALWFRSSALGDTKDRVLVRENGQTTYFASDVAYHMNKRERGFERLIDVWGADHHGYVARVKAALSALGEDPACLDVLLVQFAILYRDGEKVRMSTRSGEFITLRELRREVGNDAARFFYVMRKCEQHLDFDLDLAKSESADNPVYYIQYAHARVCSVLKQRVEKGLERDEARGNANLDRLTEDHEQALLYTLSRYPEVVEAAAHGEEPHLLAHYLRELANDFHTYYNAHPFLVEDAGLRDVRLNLIVAVRQVLRNGLRLLGVSAPETM